MRNQVLENVDNAGELGSLMRKDVYFTNEIESRIFMPQNAYKKERSLFDKHFNLVGEEEADKVPNPEHCPLRVGNLTLRSLSENF